MTHAMVFKPFTQTVAAIFGLGIVAVLMTAAVPAPKADVPPKPPLGLPEVDWPEDNPYSHVKAELGKLLYFDTRLSSDNTVSCASCHAPEHAFTDGAPFSTGIGKQVGGRSAPTVINRAYSTQQFWDGRAPSLEAQAIGPIGNPIEMTNQATGEKAHATVVAHLQTIPGYVERFKASFGNDKITIENVGKAIATFERTVYSGNAPYDRYKAGDKSALSAEQVKGMNVFFNKAACDSCHLGFNFTDGSYVNIGIGMDKPNPDLGRFKVSKNEDDKGAFKTPTLREVTRHGPYMHDGRFTTLEEVIDHYDKGGIRNPQLDERLKPLHLSPEEKKALVAFLKGLEGEGWQNIAAPKQFP